ncbi:hypothetical protein OC835_002129 [Tilletia horrida]|nr:hypothetical protein OC835_002129 [Tilletia horrida]
MSSDGSYAVLPLVQLSKAQEDRLQEETKDARENGYCLDGLATHLLPFHPQCEGRSIKELLELALLKSEDEASGGKFLAGVFGLFQRGNDEFQGASFLALDERGARSLTDDAEEALNVLAIQVESISLSYYLSDEVFEIYDQDHEDVQYRLDHSPEDSSAARLKLLNVVRRNVEERVAGSVHVDEWDQYVSFHWNTPDPEAILRRKEGKDAEALNEVRLIRLTVIRAELEAAAGTMNAAEVKDPLDMYAGVSERAPAQDTLFASAAACSDCLLLLVLSDGLGSLVGTLTRILTGWHVHIAIEAGQSRAHHLEPASRLRISIWYKTQEEEHDRRGNDE